ncbi:unnamed protein product, partial [Pocillopora meandrina]
MVYNRAFRGWNQFANDKLNGKAFPASPFHVTFRKEPISALLFHDIIIKSDLDNPVKLRNVSMYVLSFAGFFRFDDVSRVRRSDISFKGGFMIIKVLKSKNDQLRKGDEVVILQLSSSVCPLVAPDKPISYSTVRVAFRWDLQSLGVEPSKLGLHSLRSGGATMIANNGVNDRVFQRHGCWKSVQAKDTNVDDDFEQ